MHKNLLPLSISPVFPVFSFSLQKETNTMTRALYLLFLLPVAGAYAQSPQLEAITVEQGLSQGFISSMAQGEDGFLWFATSNGLNRYNGYEFTVFRNDPYDTLSIAGNGIFSIAATGEFLWLMPTALQFNIFHRATQRAYSVPVDLSRFNEFLKVVPERENAVWLLLVMDEVVKLFHLQWHKDFMAQVEQGAKPETLFNWKEMASEICDMALSEDGRKLWILGKDELHIRDLASGKTERTPLPPEMRGLQLARYQLLANLSVAPDIAGGAWVFARNRLARYDGRQWQVFPLRFNANGVLQTDRNAGIIWLRADSLVYGFDLRRLPKTPGAEDATYRLSIPEQAICSLTDRDGNVWFGTNTRGIRKFSPRRSIFRNYFPGHSFYAAPVFDSRGRAWLNEPGRGTKPGGVLDFSNDQFTPFSELGLLIRGTEALRIVNGENDRLWIATGNGWDTPIGSTKPVLFEYSLEDGPLGFIPFPESFHSPVRFEMSYQAPGEVWFGNHYQLMRFDVATRAFSLFEMQPRPKGVSGIFALVKTQGGVWWAGTPNGLLKATPNGKGAFSFTLLRTNPADRNSLPGNVVKSLLPDPANPNLLWIGTSDNGLSCLDIQNNRFTHYNTDNGLPDNTVYGILPEPATDKRKHRALWLSTNRGLTRFSPEDGNFQYFFKSDGLQENEFNTYAHGVTPRGELIFGGINGFTIFNPADITVSSRLPAVKITGLKVNGKALTPRSANSILQTDICFAERIELPYAENNLQLYFAADDYTNPARNQFAFYLEGAEPEWAHRGFEHTAQYLNLAPGQYVFHVKAANSDGVWNETPVSLLIVIRSPWYRTSWAYGLYILLLAGAAYFFYRFELKRKLERAEADRLKEMDEFKSRFFTNISHEFRTPLTVILGASEQLSEEVAPVLQGKLGLVRRSGENLLRLVNQILDLAKLESNALTINYIQGNVPTYLSYVAESLHSLANARNVMLRVENKTPEVVMDYDPERLLQIVYNLLSNAIKFTPSGGKVVLKIDLAPNGLEQNKAALRITVSDTGAGIPEEDKPYLFDRFFQARNQEFAKSGGSGIGLSLTKELVKAMGGSISVESKQGAGATFIVLLPVSQNARPGQWQDEGVDESQLSTIASGIERPLPGKHAPDSDLPALLIIEDNPDVVEYLGACLESVYQLEYAYNGRAGIEKALEMIPDIIISDVMMPEKDGFEVCEALKHDERTSHIPIILLTAKATVDDRIAGLRRGADAYIAKPFHRKELLATLSGLIELRKKLQQRYASAQVALPPASDAGVEMEDAFLSRIREAVEERLGDSALSGEDICRKLGMSYPVVYRKLSALTGRSLGVYIRLIRLQKARELLSDPSLTVSEIAYETGFNDPKFFSKVFAEEFKVTPTEFRKTVS
jgi:signal transduction histidine kinase/CheY-like chemotaxis protein/ligand-binding sensor domain-containing protein